MRSRALALRLILPAGLVVLVGVLAALEYRWLGQVSEADRERRRASLQQHAEEFADDFDRELLRLYLVLQNDTGAIQEGHVENFARHLDTWREAARDPRILRAVYLVDGDPPKLRFREFHGDTKTFVDAAWPAALAHVHTQMAAVFPDNTGAGADKWFLMPHDPVAAAVPALIVNLSSIQTFQRLDPANLMSFGHTTGFLIGLLDQDALRSSILPALAERYFPARDADSYRLEIMDVSNPAQPVLSRGLAAGAALDPKKADADVPLFALRFELTSQVVSRAVYTTDANGTQRREVTASNMMVASPTAPRVNSAPRLTSPGGGGGAARGTVWTAGPGGRGTGGTVSPAAAGGLSPAKTGFQIVVQSSGQPSGIFATRSAAPPWHLVLQHSAGSLDEAVNQARRRNLWLSFGILGVLGVGVGLIMVNAQRSERLAAQQMDFVATVSHELRTPLAVIRSAAQNLSSGVVFDAAHAKKYGDVIDAEGRRLTDMVEQVLEYAGLSGGRRPSMARAVDLGAVASETLAACEPLVATERFDLEVDIARDLPPVFADEGAIRRAVQNLITNALKYGADGRWLGVSVRPGPSRTREVQVTVADRGRGIDAADLPHIFDAFYRGRRAVDEQIHGNGLGLSLVRRIAEAHGGRVTVKSSPGEGAAFTIHLPTIEAHVRPKTRQAWADLADADAPPTS